MKKLINSNNWCHISCALFSTHYVNVTDYAKMEFEQLDVEEEDSNPCFICEKGRETRFCGETYSSCPNFMHIYCVLQ